MSEVTSPHSQIKDDSPEAGQLSLDCLLSETHRWPTGTLSPNLFSLWFKFKCSPMPCSSTEHALCKAPDNFYNMFLERALP
jgi:hypothetical protein